MFVAADAAGSGGRRLRRTDADGRVGRSACRRAARRRKEPLPDGGREGQTDVQWWQKITRERGGGMEGKLSSEYLSLKQQFRVDGRRQTETPFEACKASLHRGFARLSHYPLKSALINALRFLPLALCSASCFWQCGSAFMTNGAQFGWPNGCAAEAGNSGIDELFVGRSVGRSRRERGRASSIQGRLATICLQLAARLAPATQTQSADNDMRVNGRARARAVSPFCTSLLMRREMERERAQKSVEIRSRRAEEGEE